VRSRRTLRHSVPQNTGAHHLVSSRVN